MGFALNESLNGVLQEIPSWELPNGWANSVNGRWGVGGVEKNPGISQEFIFLGLAVQCERALSVMSSTGPSMKVPDRLQV